MIHQGYFQRKDFIRLPQCGLLCIFQDVGCPYVLCFLKEMVKKLLLFFSMITTKRLYIPLNQQTSTTLHYCKTIAKTIHKDYLCSHIHRGPDTAPHSKPAGDTIFMVLWEASGADIPSNM